MSVLYFFAMFVMFFPKSTETALAPSAHPTQYDREGQVTGVVEVV
jgi:hypothetical protein